MYEYSLIDEDGDEARYGSRPDDYQTDVFADRADAFVKRRAGRSSPFFLTVWTTAPHVEKQGFIGQPHNPRPAPRHLDRFEGESAPRTPSFDERTSPTSPRGFGRFPGSTPWRNGRSTTAGGRRSRACSPSTTSSSD